MLRYTHFRKYIANLSRSNDFWVLNIFIQYLMHSSILRLLVWELQVFQTKPVITQEPFDLEICYVFSKMATSQPGNHFQIKSSLHISIISPRKQHFIPIHPVHIQFSTKFCEHTCLTIAMYKHWFEQAF